MGSKTVPSNWLPCGFSIVGNSMWRARWWAYWIMDLSSKAMVPTMPPFSSTRGCRCSDPRALPDPISESKSKPRGCPFNSFYLHFITFFFQKCRDLNPRLDPKGGSEPEPGLLRHFQLSYQNIFFMLFLFRFSICAEAFSNGRPTNIYIS